MRLATKADARTVQQCEFNAHQVVGGHAVFETMNAAGILGDISSDRACNLTGGIRRVIESPVLHRFCDGEVGHARLDNGAAILEIDLQDFFHPREADHNAISKRQRSARKRSPRSSRNHLHAFVLTEAQHGANLLCGFRQDDGKRLLTISRECVAVVGDKRFVVSDHALWYEPSQFCNQRWSVLDCSGVEWRHFHARQYL